MGVCRLSFYVRLARANQLIREETTTDGTTDSDFNYRYDASGNMLAKESTLSDGMVETLESFSYDVFNRTESITIDETETAFEYDINNQKATERLLFSMKFAYWQIK